MTRFRVTRFHPPVIELPDCDPVPAGDVHVELPPVRIVFAPAEAVDDAIAARLNGYGVTLHLKEDTRRSMAAGMVVEMLSSLERMHATLQDKMNQAGPLFAEKQIPPDAAVKAVVANLTKH